MSRSVSTHWRIALVRDAIRRAMTPRNNALLALLTLGEGWHNNHHHYAGSARQGFFWWEVDISYYLLKVMAWLGLVWNLKPVPTTKRDAHLTLQHRGEEA